MNIQRWDNDFSSNSLDPYEKGNWVKFEDIAHLLPPENPDYEPCQIGEACGVVNARGEFARIDLMANHQSAYVNVDSTVAPDMIDIRFLSFYGLTPVRKRKIEPVVQIHEVALDGTVRLVFAKVFFTPGQEVRVTVEVVE